MQMTSFRKIVTLGRQSLLPGNFHHSLLMVTATRWFIAHSPQVPSYPNTLSSLVPHWTEILKKGCVADAEINVEIILLYMLKKSVRGNLQNEDTDSGKVSLLRKSYHQHVSTEFISEVNELCRKRAQRMPVQYVIGEWDFRDMTLKMVPPVFIPRPETEMLVELIKTSDHLSREDEVKFLEVGCGTGAISISLLREFPKASAVAIDSSMDAVNLTIENSKRYHCQERLKTYHHHLDTTCPEFLSVLPRFDFIVSNPPYIFSKDMCKLEPEISRYEDHRALDGGPDGMNVLRKIVRLSDYLLKPSGMIWFETDSNHPKMIKEWLENEPDLDVKHLNSLTDFNQRPRFVQLCYQPSSELS
ncbi:MTRF1L release factor glutamine methyltransferase-like [Anneissia japonica]|uniref:MTRF1L release factor glutamine methyltransferase-like n=1 Tax=Anneissia japonica TaxID=1529436 RepID=UPI001425564C|nr:MTRF1L release factor glutamine methyltransferase-like [Anneissia japonica]